MIRRYDISVVGRELTASESGNSEPRHRLLFPNGDVVLLSDRELSRIEVSRRSREELEGSGGR